MKKRAKILIAITLTLILSLTPMFTSVTMAEMYAQRLASAGNNLLTDGDFENPNTADWFLSEHVSITSEAKHGGNYGLKLPWDIFDTKAVFEFSQIALAPNTTYVVKADYNLNGLDPDINFDVTGGTASATRGSLSKSGWITQGTLMTIKTDAEYVYGKIIISLYRGGTGVQAAYFDNVTMIATGNEWCPTPGVYMDTMIGSGVNDDFNGPYLDEKVWLVSNTAWGGANGGLNSANVYFKNVDGRSCVVLESHGDYYEGNVQGVGGMTKRVGAGIVTRDYYASGKYTVVCKIEPQLGVCTAYWSFSYIGYMQEDTNGDGRADKYDEGDGLWQYNKTHNITDGWIQENGVRNSEIDWETPSPMDNGDQNDVVSHNNLRTNCWGGKRPGEGGNYSGRSHQQNNATMSIADGNWHTLVYEWYSTDDPYTSTRNDPALVWFIDGVQVDSYDVETNEEYRKNDQKWREDEQVGAYISANFPTGIEVPRYGTRFWLATWFPVKEAKLYCVGKSGYTGWAGTPDYDTTYTYIDKCMIESYSNPSSPRYQSADDYSVRESVPNKQFALPNEYPNYDQKNNLPGTPNPETTEKDGKVTVTWAPTTNATAYDILVDGQLYSNVTSPYVVNNLPIGNHVFKLRSKNSGKTGIWSREALVSVGVPKNVQVVADGHGLHVTWDPVAGAVDYYMEIDNQPMMLDGAYISFASGVDSPYLNGFGNGTTHHIRVRSVGPRGMSNWSGLQEKKITASGLDMVGLVLKDTGKRSFQAIIDRKEGATKYELKNCTTGEIITVAPDKSGYPIQDFNNVNPGIYYYQARWSKGSETSEWCQMAYIIVDTDNILRAPGLHAAAASTTSADIYWNEMPTATGYDLEVDGVVLDMGNTLTFNHSGLVANSVHKYRVRAKNATQVSEWSTAAYVDLSSSSGGGGGGGGGSQYTGDGTLKNGTFDNGGEFWTTDGTVSFDGDKATITAGEITSLVTQTVFGMQANTKYTFSADVNDPNKLMYIYVRNTNGNKNEISTKPGESTITFTTGDLKEGDGVTFIFSVYKQQVGSVTVDNAVLTGEGVTTKTPDPTTTNGGGGGVVPTQPIVTTTTKATPPSGGNGNLIVNGDFSEGDRGWTFDDLSAGSAIENGELVLRQVNVISTDAKATFAEEIQPNTTYTISADISPKASGVYIRIGGLEDRYSTMDVPADNLPYTFRTGDDLTYFAVSVHAERYFNEGFENVKVDNVVMAKGESIPEPTTTVSVATTTAESGSSSDVSDLPTNPTDIITTTAGDVPGDILYGDANDDGKVDMKDVLAIRKVLAGIQMKVENEVNADANADGKLDMKDVLAIRKYLANLLTKLGPQA